MILKQTKMNKFILIGSAFFIWACNNSASTSGNAKNDSDVQVNAKESPVSETACGKMVFFQQGAEVEATSYNAAGEVTTKQYTKILSVTETGGLTTANVEGATKEANGEKKNTVTYEYKCDGNKIYFDIASMFRTDAKNQDATFKSSLIEYPINLTEGETLPDATGAMTSERAGKKMEMKYHYRNRKVEGKEEVTTAAGTFNCFKISNSVEVEMDIPGMDEKTKEMMRKMQGDMKTTTTTWYAPDFGIVKMEMYMNGKLQSRNEVTSVKR